MPTRHPSFARAPWLRSKERVDFKLAVLIFRCLHGLAPCYLSDDIRRVADTNRRLLRSASSGALFVRPTRLVTMGDCAFPVAGSRLWMTSYGRLFQSLEQSTVRGHLCSHAACFLQPSKDIPVSTFLSSRLDTFYPRPPVV